MSDAGEIIGRLKLDASDFLAKIEEAKGEADSLDGVDPRIAITVDSAAALAKIAEVKAAADAFQGDSLRPVSMGSGPSNAVMATERLTGANRDLVKSFSEEKSAAETVSSELEHAARGAETAAAETGAFGRAAEDAGRQAETAGNKAAGAAQGAVPWMGILVGSIAAVAPGMVAVGAAAVGLSAELTGLGATALLAFKGIQTGIAAGLPAFAGLDDALSGLQDKLVGLELVAAGGLMPGLSSGIRTLEGDLGPITADISLLSGQLGGMLATATDTAVHAFNGFTPVLVAGGQAFQSFLQGVDGFTASNGFTDFVQYTVARLPDVMHLIESTLGAVGGIFTALAPAGQSTLFMLSSLMDLIASLAPTIGALMPAVIGLSDAIGAIALVVSSVLNYLGPLGPAVVLITGGFIGLTIASGALATSMEAAAVAGTTASLAVRALSVAVDTALGPVGLLVAAVGLIAGAVATAQQSTDDLAVSTSSLSAALQQDNGVVGENTRALMANAAVTSGAAAGASRLGISQKTLNDAMTGSKPAMTAVSTALDTQKTKYEQLARTHVTSAAYAYQYMQASDAVSKAVTQGNAALKSATDSYNKVAAATGGAKVSQQQMAAAAAAVHMPVAEFAAAAAAQQKAADTAQTTRDKYVLLGDAANLLKLDMDRLNGASISNAEAQAAWASGLDSLTSSFNKTSKSITGNSNAALENRGAVASLAATGETALQSIAGMSHSASQTTAAYKSMRAQMIDTVSAMGVSKAAATALVDQYFKIPKNIKTDFTGNDADAKAKAAAAKKAGEDFAKGDYKAALKADPATANKLIAEATSKAEQYAKGAYEAKLTGNPGPASTAAERATVSARAFAREKYEARLNAVSNAAAVAASARAALNSVRSREVYLTVYASVQGNANAAQIAKNAQMYGATGGTATSKGMQVPGMAAGGSPWFSGTVTGPGNAWNDMAGYFRLANSEEVISNMHGQADAFRGVLKAINGQKVKTPQQLGQALTAGHQGPQQVINRTIAPVINIHNPVAVDPVQQTVDAAQLALAYAGLG